MKSKYSAEEKFQIVMESFTDNVTQAEICRRHVNNHPLIVKSEGQQEDMRKSSILRRNGSNEKRNLYGLLY